MTKDTAILLVNMGSPQSEKEMKYFLKTMFNDKSIIPMPKFGRFLLSQIISRLRYKSSWQKYQLIGGSPLIETTEACAKELSSLMNEAVFTAYSYVLPSIYSQMQHMKNLGYKNIKVISMYPQSSLTTTASVERDVKKAQNKLHFNKVSFAPAYATQPSFIEYWAELVRQHMHQHNIKECLLLCSAHSIPLSYVKAGDKYPEIVENMCQKLADTLQLEHSVAYQSQVGPQQWLEPKVEEQAQLLINKGYDKIIILPISFTTECLETEYDLSIELSNKLTSNPNVQHISRVYLPTAHPLFIQTLKNSLDVIK